MAEFPRITYHAAGRTFDRLFKEGSLAETKDVVRSKLGIGADVGLALAQLRDNKRIDLDDDGDFEAFKSVLRSTSHVNVVVSVDGDEPTQIGAAGFDPALAPQASKKRTKKRQNSVSSVASAVPVRLRTPGSESRPSDTESEDSEPRRKKRKVAFEGTTVVPLRAEAAPVTSSSRDANTHTKVPATVKESKKAKDAESAKRPASRGDADVPTAKAAKHKRKKSQTESIPDVTPEPSTPAPSRPASAGIPIAIPGQPLALPTPAHIPQRPAPPVNPAPAPDAQPQERKKKRKRTATPDVVEHIASKKASGDAELKKKKKKSDKNTIEATLDPALPAPVASSPLDTPSRPLKKAKRAKNKDSVSGEAEASAQVEEKRKKSEEEERRKEKERKKKEKKAKLKGLAATPEESGPTSVAAPSKPTAAENVVEVEKAEKDQRSKAVEAAVKSIRKNASVANRSPVAASADAVKDLEKAKAKRRKSQAPSAEQDATSKAAEIPEPATARAEVEAAPAKAKRRKSTVLEAETPAPTASIAAEDSNPQPAPETCKNDAESAKDAKGRRKSKAATIAKQTDEVPAAADVNSGSVHQAPNGDAPPVKAKKAGRKSSAVEADKSVHELPASATAPNDTQEPTAELKAKPKPRKSSAGRINVHSLNLR
ncbi:hypothetical protein DENSPDRAFT_323035 [Dentipellis sp. KUC8613]|nr:hypothetical protein DENSPDRAFT_323035 [Dentipellis sp. KUC8613]